MWSHHYGLTSSRASPAPPRRYDPAADALCVVVDEFLPADQFRLDAMVAKAIKGTRCPLLKQPVRLKPGESRRPVRLRRQNRALDRAYELKNYLATILEQAKLDNAYELLNEWLEWTARSRLAPFIKLAQTIWKHSPWIVAYLDIRIANGSVKHINSKPRVIARRAYGFHSDGPLISMLYLRCGGIELVPTLPIRV